LHASLSGGAISVTGSEARSRHPVRQVAPPVLRQQTTEGRASNGTTTCFWADRDPVHDVGAAGCIPRGGACPSAPAASPPSLSPRRRLPARVGVCNDAGQCCNTLAGDVACGASCCNDI